MKLNNKIKSKKQLIIHGLLFSTALIVAISVPLKLMTRPVAADQYSDYNDKIAALQQEINEYQSQSVALNQQAATLQSALAQLANQQAAIQAQIDINQVKYDQLVQQINQTGQKIKDSQDALGKTIAEMYVDDQITPIEMLASSKNISDFMDKQEYRSSVRNSLTTTVKQIKDLKIQLDQQKSDIKKILDGQKAAKSELVTRQTEQQSLLDRTQGEENNYQALISDHKAQIAEAKATQDLINKHSSGGYIIIDSGELSDYPWNDSNCSMDGYLSTGGVDYAYGVHPPYDGQDGKGYGCRQCASYVAWRIAKETGVYYTNLGNAKDFDNVLVNTYHYKRVNANTVEGGAVAVMEPGYGTASEGHVVWVEENLHNGQLIISQYNATYDGGGYGRYSKMQISASAYDNFVQIK